jgi:dolichyl-phosphate-mannose-protein mannosyltransferase
MLRVLSEFRVGKPQMFAGLMLAAFLAQCLWTARSRGTSELEYRYMLSGLSGPAGNVSSSSPFTGLIAALPVKTVELLRKSGPASWNAALAIPRRWWLRLPFVAFGVWLGAALWWVARRLFDDEGGYVALALYCSSPAMIKISSNIGPEIILTWSLLGLIYTAIGVAHTLYAPPRKWAPRIVILGLSIGFALATAWWSVILVLLAFAYMLYLAPDCRRRVVFVLGSASVLGGAVLLIIAWITGSAGLGWRALFSQRPTLDVLRHLAFPLSPETDGYVLVLFFIAALTAYGSWPRARYFGNTAPIISAAGCVAAFAAVPVFRLWDATLGLSFVFLFVGGLGADLLETRYRRQIILILSAGFVVRAVLTLMALRGWVQNLM